MSTKELKGVGALLTGQAPKAGPIGPKSIDVSSSSSASAEGGSASFSMTNSNSNSNSQWQSQEQRLTKDRFKSAFVHVRVCSK